MISRNCTTPSVSLKRVAGVRQICSLAMIHCLSCLAATQPGTLDTSFDPGTGVNGQVLAVATQGDGKIFIAGKFTEFRGVHRKGIARLNEDGSLNTTFVPADLYSSYSGPEPPDPLALQSVVAQDDGKVIVAGNIAKPESATSMWPLSIARFKRDGSIDSFFENHKNIAPFGDAIAVQSDGKILLSKWDRPYRWTPSCAIDRFNADGTSDTNFVLGYGTASTQLPVPDIPHIYAIAQQLDGKIIIGGHFTAFNTPPFFTSTNPFPWNSLARLNSNGTFDSSFGFRGFANLSPSYFFPTISAIVVQTDGKIIVGGAEQLLRLEADGTTDPSFNPNAVSFSFGKYIRSIALQRNGQVLIGGTFTCRVGNSNVTTGLARLNPDGSLDMSFAILLDTAGVSAISTQPDGQILIVGTFSQVGGVPRNGIARINGAPSMQLFAPARDGNNFQVSCPTVAGKSYVLEYCDGLTGGSWQPTPAVTGDGTIKTFRDASVSSSLRFYRIRVD